MAVPRSALSLFRSQPVESHALDGLDAFAKCQLPSATSSRRSGGRSSAGVKAAVPGSGLPQKGGVAPAAVDIRGEASVDLGIGSQLAKAVGERRDGPEAARRTFNGKTMAQIQEERRNRAKQGAPAIAAPAAATRFRPSSGWSGRRTQSAVQSSGGGAISTGSFPSLGGLADKQQARVSALELAGQQQAASGRWALQTLDDESDEDDPEEETVALLGSEEVLPPVDAAPQSPAQFAAAVAKALDDFSMFMNVDKFVTAASKTLPQDGLGARHQIVLSVLTQTFDPSIWEERALRALPDLMLALLERHVVDTRMFRLGVSLALEQLPSLYTDYPKADEQMGRVLSAVAMKDHRLFGALPSMDGMDLAASMGERMQTSAKLADAIEAAAAEQARKEADRQERLRERDERRRQQAAKAQALSQGVVMPVASALGSQAAGGGASREEDEEKRREKEAAAEAARQAKREKAAAAAAERRRKREEADRQAKARAAEVAEQRRKKEAAARARLEAEAAAASASAALAAAPRGEFGGKGSGADSGAAAGSEAAGGGAASEQGAPGAAADLDDLYADAKPKGKKKKKKGKKEGEADPAAGAADLEDMYADAKPKGKKKKKKKAKKEEE